MAQPQRLRFANAQEAVASITRNHDEERCRVMMDAFRACGPWAVADLCAMSAMLMANALHLSEAHERESMEQGVGMLARQIREQQGVPSITETAGRA